MIGALNGLADRAGPPVPAPRGPLSAAVVGAMRGEAVKVVATGEDPYGDDLQLALHCCYELHYRGFDGIDASLEWDSDLLRLRGELERAFLGALRCDVDPSDDVDAEIQILLAERTGADARGLAHHLQNNGTLGQLREYIVHRSVYHLKEADPQIWAIPRISGPAKAGLIAVSYDEYGSGHPGRMHAALFAEMMTELGLSDAYGSYVDRVPGATLAEVNFMSLCGLHRSLRAASVGQFAMIELTSSPGSECLVHGLRRLGCGPAAIRFYDEHVVADAVHEQVIRRDVLTPLLAAEPELAADVVFGIRASQLLGGRIQDSVLSSWNQGKSSLLAPLSGAL